MKIDLMFKEYIQSPKSSMRLKQSTVSTYTKNFETYIQPFFKNINVINEDIICDFTKYLLQWLSPKTICNVLDLLSNILKFQKLDIKIYKPRYQVKNIIVLKPDEWQQLESYCLSHLDFINYGILMALYTGIRPGELCASTVDSLDLLEENFKVQLTMQRIKNPDIQISKTKVITDTPKSMCSVRDIPLIPLLVTLGKYLYGNLPKGAYLLTGDVYNFIEPRVLEYKFKEILKRSGIQEKNFYILRHTFATEYYKKTKDVKSLSELLGHADVKTTLNRYVHSCMDTKREGLSLLGIKA